MPAPAAQEKTVRGPLQDASVLFKNKLYIADDVTRMKDNVSKKAKITVYRPGDWFRDEAEVRAPGTRAKRGEYETDDVNIDPVQYAFAKEVTQEDMDAEGDFFTPPFNLQQEAIEFSVDKIDLKKEKRVAALIEDSTWADGNAAGEDAGGLWAPGGSNTFLADIRNGKATIQSKTGMIPNILVMDYGTFENLREEATIADKIKHTQTDILTEQLLANLLGLDAVLVGKAIENTANKTPGSDAFTAANIWETNAGKGGAFLFYRPSAIALRTPLAIGQFRVKQKNGAGRLTRSWREEAEDQWVYEVREDTDIVAVHLNLGYQWIDTLLT